MRFTKLIPNLFYEDIQVGMRLFIQCLEFEIGYEELLSSAPFFIAEKNDLSVMIIQDKEFAEKDRPELRLQTDDIEYVYAHVSALFPDLLHPNGNKITRKPWGAKEFALLDASGVCIIIQDWTNE